MLILNYILDITEGGYKKLNDKQKIKILIILSCILVLATLNFIVNYKEESVPHSSWIYIDNINTPSIFAEATQEIDFFTAIGSIYESKEYNGYIYTQSDLLMAKEYRLYTTDKEKLFEKIYEGENFEKSILIPIEK